MPCGEYFTDDTERLGLVKWRIQRIALVLLLVPLLVPILVPSSGMLSTIIFLYISVVAVAGLNIMIGYTGLLVLAQGALMAIGAYTAANLMLSGVSIVPSLLVAGAVTGLIGLIIGLPSFRMKGIYIGIATLALQYIVEWWIDNPELAWVHGGAQLIMPREMYLFMGFLPIDSMTRLYYLTLVAMLLFVLMSFNISRTSVGRSLRAVRDNDIVADVLGIPTYRYKLISFSLGSFYVGIAGGLWSIYVGFISTEHFGLQVTLDHYVMLLFGGLGRVWGVIIGAATVTVIQEFLRDVASLVSMLVPGLAASVFPMRQIVFGIVIILVLVIEPKGVLAALGQLKEYLRNWPYAY